MVPETPSNLVTAALNDVDRQTIPALTLRPRITTQT